MKKKLVVMLFAAVLVLGFTSLGSVSADNQIPKITSGQND